MENTALWQYGWFSDTLETPHFGNTQKMRRFLTRAMEFFKKDSIMYHKQRNAPPQQVLLAPLERTSAIRRVHDELGHKGVQATFELLRRRVYWPHLYADVKHYVCSCHKCQVHSLHRLKHPLTISTPVTLFSKVSLDSMYMLETGKGLQYIIASGDDLSGDCIPSSGALSVDMCYLYIQSVAEGGI